MAQEIKVNEVEHEGGLLHVYLVLKKQEKQQGIILVAAYTASDAKIMVSGEAVLHVKSVIATGKPRVLVLDKYE